MVQFVKFVVQLIDIIEHVLGCFFSGEHFNLSYHFVEIKVLFFLGIFLFLLVLIYFTSVAMRALCLMNCHYEHFEVHPTLNYFVEDLLRYQPFCTQDDAIVLDL